MGGTPVPYDLLAIFAAVAEESSFSRAAHKLGVGKSTVSRSIARLEEQLGAALIHRSTHKVALSTAGTALYERVAPHLAALGQAVGKLPESAAEPSGELRMTVPHDFGAIVLPALLAQFSLRHPEVSFDVRVTNRQIDLVSEGIDLAIRASPQRLKDSSLTARRLGDVLMACYAAPSYLARRGEPRSFGDPKHEWAVFPPLLALAQVPKEFRPRVRADDFLLLRALLAEGAGVGARRCSWPRPTWPRARCSRCCPRSCSAARAAIIYCSPPAPSARARSRRFAILRSNGSSCGR